MKIAAVTDDEITISQHFGRAAYYWVVTIENGVKVSEEKREKLGHTHFPGESHADEIPDIIVVEDEVEKLMWINLAYLHATGGERVQGSTAILQATCVDSTIIPFLENRLNFGMGCYGCREATDLGPNETVVGFPMAMLDRIVAHITFLGQKAISNSRTKKVFKSLEKRTPDQS